MDCEEFLSEYSDFLDRRFEEHALSSYCQHLLNCPDCSGYDRVMRRGLNLVRQLERPESGPDFFPRLRLCSMDPPSGLTGRSGVTGRAVATAGLAGFALAVVASMGVLASGRRAVELPPVVVEAPANASELPSLWGPAPKFSPQANLLQVPSFPRHPLLIPPPQRLSLFRTPLRAPNRSPPVAGASEVAPE